MTFLSGVVVVLVFLGGAVCFSILSNFSPDLMCVPNLVSFGAGLGGQIKAQRGGRIINDTKIIGSLPPDSSGVLALLPFGSVPNKEPSSFKVFHTL